MENQLGLQLSSYGWIFLGLFLVLGCQPEELPQTKLEDAEIYFFGDLGEQNELWIAGDDSLYNFTSYLQNDLNILEFRSRITSVKEVESKPFIELVIYDRSTINNPGDPQHRYVNGSRSFLVQSDFISDLSYEFTRETINFPVQSFFWEMDQNISWESQASARFEAGRQPMICLHGILDDGDTISTCKRINSLPEYQFEVFFEITETSQDSLLITAQVHQMMADQWVWDGKITTDNSFKISKEDAETKRIHDLRILKNDLPIYETSFYIESESSNPQFRLNYLDFSYQCSVAEYLDDQPFEKVIFNYFDPERGLFSSRYSNVNRDRVFTILDDQFFKKNEDDIPTRKITFQFEDVMLSNEWGDSVKVSTEKSIMAFPDP